MSKPLVAFNYDPDLRDKANRAGRNYWHEYVTEICDRLGVTAEAIPRSALAEPDLSGISVIILGQISANDVPRGAAAALRKWVEAGGVLIGFATEGLDDLFGNECSSATSQPTDDFTLTARFAFADDPITEGIHSYLHPQQKLLIFSDARNITPKASSEIARLFDLNDRDTHFSAITHRRIGKGHAYYFAFDVTKTLWVLQQGRPVDKDYDGDGYFRMGDALVTRGNEAEVMYADEIAFLLQNMIGVKRVPMIHQLPPENGEIPDALFYWGGDDEGMAGVQLESSNFMKKHGLPYHLNIMPQKGKFNLTDDEAGQIEANGHELALHINFIDDYQHPLHYTRDDIKKQMDMFTARFGRPSVCSVFHWCLWTGWAEPAMWISEFGGKADNSRIHHPSPPLNPVNLLGFSFGTAFPFYIYCDHHLGNKRLDFLSEPITAYEVGYTGQDETHFDVIHKCVDIACAYHLTLNLFYHPPNVARRENCRRAVLEVLRYIKEKDIAAVHMGNDELCHWWNARSAARIEEVAIGDARLCCTASCDHPRGMIVKVALRTATASRATCDGTTATLRLEKLFGQNWAYVAVPRGTHKVEVLLGERS